MSDQVVREQFLPVDPREAWEALEDPAGLQRWLAEEVEAELEPGGEARFRLPDGEERTGFVEEVTPPRRLVFWWGSAADGNEPLSRVEIALEEAEGGTLVRVTETREPITLQSILLPLDGGHGTTGPQMRASASPAAIG
jgi:uncharacterized protein YndB with AHSA1/START domain